MQNKSNSSKPVKLEYKFDTTYYELKINRKLDMIERNSQGKEEVEVKLINTTDLDSLI